MQPPLPQPCLALPVLTDDATTIVAALADAAKHEQAVFLTAVQCRALVAELERRAGDVCVFVRELV